MSRLTRDETAEPVSRDQILRHARGQGNIHLPCSADHEQDWQPYPVDPYSAICDDHTYIHTYWLPSRFGLSVETRRQYGWLRMVFSGVRLFRAPIWWPSGGWRHARGREHCRGEPGSSLSGGYAPDSAKAEGSSIVDEPGEG